MNCQETLEAMFRGMLQNEVPMTDILIALQNVSAHGELIGGGGPHDDVELSDLFDGFDISIRAARGLEGR